MHPERELSPRATAADLTSVRSLPLFPLAGALLLPRGSLPLHIFEPRYLAMIDDAMAGNRLIGMIQPKTEGEPPALYSIGCAGRITAHTQAADGRRFITLTGVSRFAVGDELPLQKGYRRADVDWARFVADLGDDGSETIDDATLLASLRAYFTAHSYDTDWSALKDLPPAALVNLLAMMCPFEPREKQALLEAQTLVERARVLTALLDLDSAANVAPASPSLQ